MNFKWVHMWQIQILLGPPLPPEKKLSKEAVLSLLIHAGFQFGASMSAIFLNLYLWRLTHSLAINGLYIMISYTMVALAFMFGGKWTKKKDRMFSIRIGIGMLVVFYLFVVVFQEKIVDYFAIFAFFNGIAIGLYWIGYLTLMYDVSTDQNRMRYISFNLIFFTVAGLFGPALAGFIITQNDGLSGYVLTFAAALAVFLATILLSIKVKTVKTHHKAYYLKYVHLLIRKNKKLKRALLGYYIIGVFQGNMLFLPNILLYQVVPREDIVGYLGVFFSVVSILSSYIMSRIASEKKERLFVQIANLGTAAGTALLLFPLSLWTIAGFMVAYSFFFPLQNNSMTSYYYRLIGKLPLKGQLRVESVVSREIFLDAGRVSSIALLIIFVKDVGAPWLPWFIIVAAILQFSLHSFLEKEI